MIRIPRKINSANKRPRYTEPAYAFKRGTVMRDENMGDLYTYTSNITAISGSYCYVGVWRMSLNVSDEP